MPWKIKERVAEILGVNADDVRSTKQLPSVMSGQRYAVQYTDEDGEFQEEVVEVPWKEELVTVDEHEDVQVILDILHETDW